MILAASYGCLFLCVNIRIVLDGHTVGHTNGHTFKAFKRVDNTIKMLNFP